MPTYTAEQRLQKAVIDIMSHPNFVALSGVLMVGSRSVSDEPMVPDGSQPLTAYTDGKNEVYGRAFVDSLNDAELRFLVLHEVGHKMYRHLTTWRWMFDECKLVANMACDHVINNWLTDEAAGFASMTGPLLCGVCDPKYKGWDAAQVYHDMMKNVTKVGGKGKGNGTGFDQHGWDEASEMTAEEQTQLARELDEALRQGALMAGTTGSGGSRAIGELLEPQVNWREALRDFVATTCRGNDYSTWARPNRRYVGLGHYMPSGISESVGELVIAIDTSGSTYAPGVLDAFMSEVKSICDTVRPAGVRILYWDTAICGDEYYPLEELDKLLTSTKPEGGGSTMVEVVPAHIAAKSYRPQAVVVLTDGYLGGGWGEWNQPVLWCVLDNKSAVPTVGKVLHIRGDRM